MAGAALECVHCYSLVHDDLPAMDNDDLRRGQPTAHKAFDEATAILAGDGLLTFAFDILSRHETHADPRVRIELVMALARASGVGGMAGGQMLDLAAEGRFVQNRAALEFSEKDVRTLQAMKDRRAVALCLRGRRHFGRSEPRATRGAGTLRQRGPARRSRSPTIYWISKAIRRWSAKQTGKDAAAGKGHPGERVGRAHGQGPIEELVNRSRQALAPFGSAAAILIEGAKFVADRHA